MGRQTVSHVWFTAKRRCIQGGGGSHKFSELYWIGSFLGI